MKKLLLVTSWLVGPALLLAQNPNYVPSGPTPLGPGHPDWKGQTIQSGQLSPAAFARSRQSRTVVWPLRQLTAIARCERPASHRSRNTSLITRMDNLSLGICSSWSHSQTKEAQLTPCSVGYPASGSTPFGDRMGSESPRTLNRNR